MVNFTGCNEKGREIVTDVHSLFTEYDTIKLVSIKNKKVAVLNRVIQLAIIGYLVIGVIICNKGYQKFDVGLSSVTTKVKGVVQTNLSINYRIRINNNKTIMGVFNQGLRTWDPADYVTPAEEHGAVFVMTNMILTPEQKQGKCPDYRAECKNDSDCYLEKIKFIKQNLHGILTGKCVESGRPDSKMCEIQGWCPVGNEKLPMDGTNFGEPLSNKTVLFEEAINFAILIKNTVRFPEFDVTVRNIDDEHGDVEYLTKCIYHPKDQRLCPIITLKTIFDKISDTSFKDTAIKGGVVAIKITWDCDLDWDSKGKKCRPRYSFLRLDKPGSKIAPGYNLRIPQYDITEKQGERRTLIKAYGIRFVILVDAQAGKFNLVPLLRNVGAGLGLLAVATIMCDICVKYCLHKRAYYRSQIYHYADPENGENQSMGIEKIEAVNSTVAARSYATLES